MNAPFDDLSGQTFGLLTATYFMGVGKHRNRLWKYQCKCGETRIIPASRLKSGGVLSCGCKQHLPLRSRYPEYTILNSAIQRCKPNSPQRRNYYSRGIIVCKKWSNFTIGFDSFLAHIGPRPTPKHTLDRINNDKGYEPGNVRWATRKEQAANKRPMLRLEKFSTEILIDELQKRGYSAVKI